MANLFDKNGNATETHTVTVSGFDSVTGEFINTYDVRIFAGTGIPGFSTLSLAPSANAGYAVCWDGSAWKQIIDLRGSTAYETTTGDGVRVKTLGPLADKLTSIAPATPYDKWDGNAWVTDSAALHEQLLLTAESKRQLKIDAANDVMNGKQWPGKAAIGRLKGEELANYNLWLDHLDALYAVDISAAPDIEWPTAPVA